MLQIINILARILQRAIVLRYLIIPPGIAPPVAYIEKEEKFMVYDHMTKVQRLRGQINPPPSLKDP